MAEPVYRRVVVKLSGEFLAGGANGLTVLRQGKDPQSAMPDIEAMESYFRASSPITPGPMDRIQRLN